MNGKYPLALPEGSVLAGQYIILKVLGQGGFGITYSAEDHKTGKTVAIKEFFPDTMATRTQTMVVPYTGDRGENYAYGKECFLQEAETLAQFIGNDGIVRIYSYFEENGTAYFVMDYIEGTNLDDYIKQHGGKLSFEETYKILAPVMDALGIVHSRGIIHRDVTPDNIYLMTDGKVKLLDFGAARYSLGDRSQSLDVVLKHGFAPKEQYVRRGKQGPYTDVYALGATFYFALTGKRPPDAVDRMEEDNLVPPSTLGVAIPAKAEQAILTALNVRADERYQSMQAFHDAMGQTPQKQAQSAPVQNAVQPDLMNAKIGGQVGSKLSAYIDAHRKQFEYLTVGLFCALCLFHVLVLFWAVYSDVQIVIIKDGSFDRYEYMDFLIALPLITSCAMFVYAIRKQNNRFIRRGYVAGTVGFAIFLLTGLYADFSSRVNFIRTLQLREYGYGWKDTHLYEFLDGFYYGIVYVVCGLVLFALFIAKDRNKKVPDYVFYIFSVVQSIGLFVHLNANELHYGFIFALVNAAAYIALLLFVNRQRDMQISSP